MQKISVIIPIYNAEKYLLKCIDSIINQDFTIFEIICIDDGSKDNSLTLLNEYKKRDNRILVFTQNNQGQGVARNKGIQKATGDFLVFIDPDDYIEQSYFKTIVSYFNKFDDEILLFNHYYEQEDSKQFILKFPCRVKIKHEQEFCLKSYLDKKNFSLNFAVWDKIFKREFITNNKIEFGIGKIGEDQIFSIKSLLLAKKVRYLDFSFYHYVQRAESIKRQSTKKIVIDVISNFKVVKEFLNCIGLANNLFYKEYTLRFLGHMYLNAPAICKPILRKILKSEIPFKDYRKFVTCRILKQSYIKKFFSIENYHKRNKKVKVLTVFGFKFKL